MLEFKLILVSKRTTGRSLSSQSTRRNIFIYTSCCSSCLAESQTISMWYVIYLSIDNITLKQSESHLYNHETSRGTQWVEYIFLCVNGHIMHIFVENCVHVWDQCLKFSQKSCRSSWLESQIINIKLKKNQQKVPGPPPKLSASAWRTCGNFQHCVGSYITYILHIYYIDENEKITLVETEMDTVVKASLFWEQIIRVVVNSLTENEICTMRTYITSRKLYIHDAFTKIHSYPSLYLTYLQEMIRMLVVKISCHCSEVTWVMYRNIGNSIAI